MKNTLWLKHANHPLSLQPVIIFCNSNIKESLVSSHHTHITIVKMFENGENYPDVTQRHEVREWGQKNGTERSPQQWVATNLQVVKSTASVKGNKLACKCMEISGKTQTQGAGTGSAGGVTGPSFPLCQLSMHCCRNFFFFNVDHF